MFQERFKIIPACHLFLFNDGKILMMKRFNTGYEDGKYSLIAGHLNGNETFSQAMIREAKEEANIILDPEKIKIVHIMHRAKGDNDSERIDAYLYADKWGGEIQNMEPNRCGELRWFPLENLPKNIIPFIERAIDNIKNDIPYSEFGFQPKS